MTNAREIRAVLDRMDLPRARFVGSAVEPRWTHGYGISVADGQVTVWCNPGNDGREAWSQSARLARRVNQILTLAGYPTYHDTDRDPQQVIVTGPRRDPHRWLANLSRVSSVIALAFLVLAVIVEAHGPLLAAAVFLLAAMWLGIEHDVRSPITAENVSAQRREEVGS